MRMRGSKSHGPKMAPAAIALALALTACSPNSIVEDRQSGVATELAAIVPMPDAANPGGYLGQDGPLAARLPENRIGIITWGSSSCPLTATSINTLPGNLVELSFESSKNTVCTDDLAPSSHIINLPNDAPPNEFTLRIRYPDSSPTKDVKVS